MAIEVCGKISLEEFGGSAGHNFFKKSSFFSCFAAFDVSHATVIITSQILFYHP